jgi:hypothetical protein
MALKDELQVIAKKQFTQKLNFFCGEFAALQKLYETGEN